MSEPVSGPLVSLTLAATAAKTRPSSPPKCRYSVVFATFLLGTTVYIAIPSLMVFLTLVVRPRISRITNIVLSILFGLTIVAGAIGEWNYYIFASGIELALLATIVFFAWTWPRAAAEL